MASRSSGRRASSVKSCISMALSSVFDAQNPRPTCMIRSGLGGSLTEGNQASSAGPCQGPRPPAYARGASTVREIWG